MAEEIRRRGGKIRLNAEAVALKDSAIRLNDGEQITYDVLIGADGPRSFLTRHLGLKHDFITASQYRIALDTRGMDYLEFYFDKRFSFGYAWIFPKEGVANVGLAGNFARLDAFLRDKGLDGNQILKKEAGIIPTSGIGQLVWQNIALIGDAASMPNPSGASGLSPIIQAARILAANIDRLERYQTEVANHPMASPVLVKGAAIMKSFTNRELASIGSFVSGLKKDKGRAPYLSRLAKYPALLLNLVS